MSSKERRPNWRIQAVKRSVRRQGLSLRPLSSARSAAVAHYYFDIVEGDNRTLDEVGVDLADKVAATTHAASLLVELARDVVRDGDLAALVVEVRNEVGQREFIAKLRIQLSDQT